MINQKAISLKINTDLLQELDNETRLGWTKRNGHINKAISLYLEFQDLRRRTRVCPHDRDWLIEVFLKEHGI